MTHSRTQQQLQMIVTIINSSNRAGSGLISHFIGVMILLRRQLWSLCLGISEGSSVPHICGWRQSWHGFCITSCEWKEYKSLLSLNALTRTSRAVFFLSSCSNLQLLHGVSLTIAMTWSRVPSQHHTMDVHHEQEINVCCFKLLSFLVLFVTAA